MELLLLLALVCSNAAIAAALWCRPCSPTEPASASAPLLSSNEEAPAPDRSMDEGIDNILRFSIHEDLGVSPLSGGERP